MFTEAPSHELKFEMMLVPHFVRKIIADGLQKKICSWY
ncbi:hypothetical protein CFter6_3117 [Collimonas fungivorans]|uniref:Uncharacterized protein n=1 Tax=Collimonas fungivorans TaxID=158899 RepID=A0A127PD91_9BURK|nr:hypothetical protein CFter6_3117 [Collimonas fungivorans]